MAYRADIEIAVKGAQELKRLQDQVSATSKLVEGLNNYLENIGSGGVVRSIQNLRNVVNGAASALGEAAIGTKEATIAAEQYVKATNNLNAGLREQSNLIERINRQERAAALVRIGVGAPAQQLLLSAARPGAPAMGGGARRRVTGSVERLGGARSGDEAATALRFAQGLKEQVRPLSQIEALYAGIAGEALKLQSIKALPDTQMLNAAARGLQTIEAIEGRRLETAKRRGQKLQEIQNYYGDTGMANAAYGFQGPAVPSGGIRRNRTAATTGGGFGKGIRGAISNAAIGGAFPLLFGQSGGAAAGGALGGIAGSFLGPSGGFAGSLVGTIIGEKLGQGNQIKELAADIGFSAEQTKLLADAFKQAGKEFDKFDQSVQNIRGLSLSIDDQADSINLVSTLTEKYGGQIDKVTNAFTSALESGKVTQATLNQLTSQGIPIQQALADKYNVSRDAILKMAKDGKISTQELTDTLVDMGNKGVAAINKPASGFDQFNAGVKSLISAIGELASAIVRLLTPAFNWLAKQLAVIISAAAQGIQTVATLLSGGNAQTVVANARARKRLAAEGGPSTGTRYLTPAQQARLNVLQQEEQKKSIKPTKIGAITAPGQAPPSGGSKGTSAADKAARDAKRLAEETAKQLITSQKLLVISKAELIVAQTVDPLKKNEAQYNLDKLKIAENYASRIKEFKSADELRNLKAAQTNELEIVRFEYLKKQTDELLRQAGISDSNFGMKPTGISWSQATQFNFVPTSPKQEELTRVKDEMTALLDPINQVTTAAQSIGDAFSTSFKGIIDGSMTAREALSGFFSSVASAFLDMSAKIIAKWIEMTILNSILSLFPGGSTPTTTGVGTNFSSAIGNDTGISWASALTKRASGGPVSAGTPYMVGEKGPELFMPGRSGTIIPNNAMGGGSTNVVVNVDASGSNVQGDQAQAKQLGVVVSAAVQAELVKQQRPGGLLAGTRR